MDVRLPSKIGMVGLLLLALVGCRGARNRFASVLPRPGQEAPHTAQASPPTGAVARPAAVPQAVVPGTPFYVDDNLNAGPYQYPTTSLVNKGTAVEVAEPGITVGGAISAGYSSSAAPGAGY